MKSTWNAKLTNTSPESCRRAGLTNNMHYKLMKTTVTDASGPGCRAADGGATDGRAGVPRSGGAPRTMPVITFQLDARISVNGTVYVFDQLSAPSGHQMHTSVGNFYRASVTLSAGNYTYKFRDGASGEWEDLIDQSCAVEARSGRARQLVVTTGQDSTVGPFCFGSCHACMVPPPPLAPAAPPPSVPPRGFWGPARRRRGESDFPVWVVLVVLAIVGITLLAIALAGADRRRTRRRRERDLGQLEPLDERFRPFTLHQTSMAVANPGAAERPPPRECAQSVKV